MARRKGPLRSWLAGDRGAEVDEVVRRSRSLIRTADLPRLWAGGARRQTVAAAVLALYVVYRLA